MTAPKMAGWNLALRFGLEVTALIAIGIATWSLAEGPTRWVAVILAPLLAVVAWGTLNVSGDPSRSGRAPVEVPGWARLFVEVVVLGGGVLSLFLLDTPLLATVVASLLLLHYLVSWRRVRWLLSG